METLVLFKPEPWHPQTFLWRRKSCGKKPYNIEKGEPTGKKTSKFTDQIEDNVKHILNGGCHPTEKNDVILRIR
jgi:hypothetical protein